MIESRPKVIILILNWNGREDTIRCLESLARTDYRPVEVILIDNGSVDDSAAYFRARYPDVTVVENGVNLGFCEGNNVGIRRALATGADYVMLLNNDATLAPDALTRLVAAGEADPRIGILGPKTYEGSGSVLYTTGRPWFPSIGLIKAGPGEYDQSCERPALAGHAFMIKRDVLVRLGGLDPEYFAYFEEVDFCVRARAAGFTCRYVGDAVAWHKGKGSNAGLLRPYLLHRNPLMFARKNATSGQLAIFLVYFLLYQAPRAALGYLVHGRFAHLGVLMKALLWHVGLFHRDNPVAAQLRGARSGS